MIQQQVAPYGSWKSPITSDLIAAGSINLGQIVLAGETVYWVEGRPAEGGRHVIVSWTPEAGAVDVTPPGFDAHTRAHEYGGGAFTVADGVVYFVHYKDQRLYRQSPGAGPEPMTPESDGKLRYADAIVDGRHGRLICVREDHTTGGHEAVNTLVSLDLDADGTNEGAILVAGNDFYSSPRLSPNGQRLAWLTWNHPHMPWDGAELWLADVTTDGSLKRARLVAGGVGESIFQPEWSADGELYFISDRTGWWNLYRWRDGRVEALHEKEAEFGRPQWVFGMSTYGFATADSIICSYTQAGVWRLAQLNTNTGQLTEIDTPYSTIGHRGNLKVAAGHMVFVGGSATEPASLVRYNVDTRQGQVLRQAISFDIDADYLSTPRAIEFPTESGLTGHAFYYPPQHRDYTGPQEERPPLIVISHGGPTSATTTILDLGLQYWTSRGFAVLDVNYGGSTGYGRPYRQRLNGQWGIVDVQDCVNGARYLAAQGEVDSRRLAVRGGSAGGYVTLCALTFHDVFSAGASHFGVSDLEALARETHKFESRYLDSLIGPYPERRDLYVERSPIHFAHRINAALILFQGLDDKVVPPNQAERMFYAVRASERPVAYLSFEGEPHGFRRAENIKRALDAELYFYSKVFGFELAVAVEPVVIENL